MSSTADQEREFVSDLFIAEVCGDEGQADGLPSLSEVGIDEDLKHPYWLAEMAGRHLVGLETSTPIGVVSYGYTVYKELLQEMHPVEAVYLDPRCFLAETNLLDVLEEAAKYAIDQQKLELVLPILTGMVHTAQTGNFGGDKMRPYMATVMSSADYASIKMYTDFMNLNTLKGQEDSKVFLKQMAHSIQAIPENKGMYRAESGLRSIEKQILLEDVGHAWIRKAMPVAEIDWLP